MPNLNICIGKRVSDEIKNELQLEIGSTISIIPGKTIENTVIMINDNYQMFNNGEKVERVFVDVRLFKSSSDESKKAFSDNLFSIFAKLLDIPPNQIQINYIELSNWASNGVYR
jgi:phenylpyruvate tautomerase PptA (4-oxalocrotonate tautomerase family)